MADLGKTRLAKKNMLAALIKTMGVVTPACEAAGVLRVTYYKWLKTDPKFKAKVEDIPNICIDFAESKLFMAIQNGDRSLIKFYLETKGKSRGYIKSVELTGAGGAPLTAPTTVVINNPHVRKDK